MKLKTLCVPVLLLFLVTGCDQTPPAEVEALQGTWKGKETTENKDCQLTVTGRSLQFKMGEQSYEGTYALAPTDPKQLTAKVTKSTVTSYVGQEAKFIYKIDAGTLTLTGFGPGKGLPASFDQAEARKVVLKK